MRMFERKRAEMELRIIVGVILVIVFIIGSIMMATAIGKWIYEDTPRQTCKDSLKLSAIKLEGLNDKFGNPVDIKCYTDYENYRTQDNQEIKKIIANKMVECWDLYGNGQMEIFDTEDNNYCVVCSRLTFDKKTELQGFTSYLNNNIAPYKKMSYLEYLAGVSMANFEESGYENSEVASQDTLPINESMAVMFTMGKNANPDAWRGVEDTKIFTTGTGVAIGTGVGILTGLVVAGLIACPETIGIGCLVSGVAYSGLLLVGVITGTTIAGGVAGGTVGYAAGASRTADWNAQIMLWPYDKIGELNCTSMEGKSGHLEIRQI
jgi:hypothetical protein